MMEDDSAAMGECVSWMELSELESELESELFPDDEESEVDPDELEWHPGSWTKAAIVNLFVGLT